MQSCDVELLELLLASDDSALDRLATGDEITHLKDPALLQRLLERGLDPSLRNYCGQTLAEVFQEHGNDILEQMLKQTPKPSKKS
jgi:MoxR-like ATPase